MTKIIGILNYYEILRMKFVEDITFKEIDETNKNLVLNVSLKPTQVDFIETVDECLKEAEQYEQWRPRAIYMKDTVIGFAMYGSFGPNRDTWIDRIIIDEKFQGQGYGKKAMKRLIPLVANEYDVRVIYLSIVPENEIAYKLYTILGFEYINEKDPEGELIFKYEINE